MPSAVAAPTLINHFESLADPRMTGKCHHKLIHIALNVVKADKKTKLGVKTKRLMAGWDDQYLASLLQTM